MSNGESKIAESKAALCCGFAIALRALFLEILSYSPSHAEGIRGWVVMLSEAKHLYAWNLERFYLSVIASEPIGRAWQSTVCKARIMRILCLLIASLRSQ